MPEWLELCAVQLPGRGWRLSERPVPDLQALADQAADAIADHADRPFGIFGHSMGAWVALLVARNLQERGRDPLALVVSGRQAPSRGSIHPPMSHLDDDEFVREVQVRYGGIPREILADREVLDLLLPSLRSDVEGLERYEHRAGPPIRCPLLVVGGEHDPLVPVGDLASWEEEAAASFQIETLPGDHFYFRGAPGPLVRLIEDQIRMGTGIGSGAAER